MSSIQQQDLFVGGTEGYHTYRIPALVVSTSGAVLGFCEGRKYSANDWGRIDILLKRTTDGGESWEPLRVVQSEGRQTIGNPAPVVDHDSGRIWLLFCRNNDRVFVTYTDDEGLTWSHRKEITPDVKCPGWRWYATGPGHAVQLHSGRLLVPCDHGEGRLAVLRHHLLHAHAIYSDDGGRSWQLGGQLRGRTDECMAVERGDGSVYLTVRNSLFPNRRAFSVSRDGGESWSELRPQDALVGPKCQASILSCADGSIIFANPAGPGRENMTVRVSVDDCRTWSPGVPLHAGPSGYSDLAQMPDGIIACLYENGTSKYHEKITIARVPKDCLR